ncbi:hypothetical protein IAT38_003591 [Cryptococcus sp. DSM 104549]
MSSARRESSLEGEWDDSARTTTDGSSRGGERLRNTSGSSSRLGGSSRRPSTPPRSTASNTSDGFLGDVARWRDEGGSIGARTSRMIGSKIGLSPPPPPGPPPSQPPPLPPASAHPFASATRPRQSGLPNARFSTLSAFRKLSNSRPGSPAGPPPSGGLPPIPTAHSRSRSKGGMLDSPPVSPTNGAGQAGGVRGTQPFPASRPIPGSTSASPQATHLSPPSQPAGDQGPSGSGASTSGTRTPRTPSRHLLQTALDLAQKAVEMDRDNDVKGALAAYREAVSRLKSVMERVGMEGGDERRKRAGSGSGKTEEEGRTLKGIHDAYVARIQLLSSYDAGPGAGQGQEQGQEQAEAQASAPRAAQPQQQQQPISTSSSTASIISQTQQSSVGGTPRQSLDDGVMTGIGNLMLADEPEHDVNGGPLSPPRLKALSGTAGRPETPRGETRGLEAGQSPQLPSINGTSNGEMSLQQALDQAAEGAASSAPRGNLPPAPAPSRIIGLGHPSSSPSRTLPISISSHTRTTSIDSAASLSPSSRRLRKASRPSVGLDMEADLSGIDGVAEGVEVLATTPTEGKIPEGVMGIRTPTGSAHTPDGRRSRTPSPQTSVHSEERPLPPLPGSATLPSNGVPISSGRTASLSGASVPIQSPGAFLVSPSTKQGAISQRRQSRTASGEMDRLVQPGQGQGESPQANGQAFPASATGTGATTPSRRMSSSSLSLGFGRARAKSQPGARPADADLPPVPTSTVRHQPSFSVSSQMSLGGAPQIQQPGPLLQQMPGGGGAQGLRINTEDGRGLAPPAVVTSRSGSTAYSYSSNSPRSLPPLPDTALGGASFNYSSISLASAHLEPQPTEEVLRPFHVLRMLRQSMNPDGQGASLTPGIYIRPGMWSWSPHSAGSSAPPKIIGQDVKVRCMHALFLGLEGVRGVGIGLLEGPREYSRKEVAEDEAKRKMGEEFCRVLEELEEEMDSVAKMLGKGGVAVGEWKGKKSGSGTKSWGSRISRGMDKISNSKTIDTPEKYVENLQYLCGAAQVLHQHLLNYLGPATPAYASLPEKPYREIEVRLRRTTEFVGKVVVPFVLEDFKAFMLRYLKGGMRYLEE